MLPGARTIIWIIWNMRYLKLLMIWLEMPLELCYGFSFPLQILDNIKHLCLDSGCFLPSYWTTTLSTIMIYKSKPSSIYISMFFLPIIIVTLVPPFPFCHVENRERMLAIYVIQRSACVPPAVFVTPGRKWTFLSNVNAQPSECTTALGRRSKNGKPL